jgi:hypothetical protein
LVAALALVSCGRKSGLDQPPAAAIADSTDPVDPTGLRRPGAGPGVDGEGRPIGPESQKKRVPLLDWLVD